jgi:hypothetical protein
MDSIFNWLKKFLPNTKKKKRSQLVPLFSHSLYKKKKKKMGNDGGSIPRRIELVKEKQKDVKLNPDLERAATWLHCALSKVSSILHSIQSLI